MKTFWITNISKMNVTLSDLNLTVPSFTSINLLDKRRYQYTEEQLQKSAENGSLFKKRDKISIRKVAPNIIKKNIMISDACIPNRERSVLEIKQDKYEELNISDEDFAKENADIADLDIKIPLSNKE